MATKSENISLKKLPKFQKTLKSKFKDNISKTKITEKKDKVRLQKIKLALQKSKIKNKTAILNLNKVVYKNKEITDLVNSSFSELIKSPEKFTISKFFEVYDILFYDIPKKGEKSHESLINQSREYINNYTDPRDRTIEELINLLEKKDEELNLKQNPNPNEHLFYPDGTFLRTHGWNTEFVEGVPQGLPIWVMQEGKKREFKNYDIYNIVKKALGFEQMSYDNDKKELLGQTDIEITELLHTSDINYIPTGRDISDDSDLNKPPGPDLEIDVSLATILDYVSADLTCLEGSSIDPNAVQPEDYVPDYDVKDSCYVRYWVLDGTRVTSRRWDPGETIHAYFRKDNPNFSNPLLQDSISGDEDGIFNMQGYIRFDYDNPENTPTKYVNTPIVNFTSLPNYIPPKYSNYGTRMYQRYGYGDQRPADGSYKSAIPDDLWENVLDDPDNIFYNNSHKWDGAKKADNMIDSDEGGYLGGSGGYSGTNRLSNIYKWWDGDNNRHRYVVNVGRRNSAMFRKQTSYFVIIDKNYNKFFSSTAHPNNEIFSPTDDIRLKSSKKVSASPYFMEELDVVLENNYARRFPKTEDGFYIPQEYWDEYGLE